MRLTDFCHLIDLRAPVLRAFPIRSAVFTAWKAQESWAPVLDRGTECFHDTQNASADRSETRAACFCLFSSCTVFGVRREQRGRFLPTAPAIDQASDTSVASPSSVEVGQGLRSAVGHSRSRFARAFRDRLPREGTAKVAVTTDS